MRVLASQAALLILLGAGLLTLPAYNMDAGSLLYGCALSVTVICAWLVLSWRFSGGAAFDPYVLFLLAAICFNAGHIVLYAFGVEHPGSFLSRFSAETTFRTMMLVAVGLASFHFGGLYARRRSPTVGAAPADGRDEARARATAIVGILLFAFSFPAWLLVISARIQRVMQYGYFVANFGAEPATGLSHLPELLAEALAPAMIFLIAGSKDRPALRRFAVAGIAAFGAATLFTGSKGPAVMAFLAFGWVWHRSIRPLRPMLLAASAAALAIIVIPLTTAVRETAGRDRASVSAITDAYFEIDNPLVAFLSETGWTGTTIAHTVEMIPEVRGFDYGQSYMYAALAVIPNLGGGLHPVKERGFLSDWLVSSLAPEYAARGGGWGFSFIAEAYANFGLLGTPIALMAIGYLLGRLFAWAQSSRDPGRIAMVGACLCGCLLFARGESALLLRGIVWYALTPYLCVALLTSKSQDAPLHRFQKVTA